MFNKPASDTGLLRKSSCLAAALGVTELITDISICLVMLCCIFELTGLFNKSSCLAPALGVTKILTVAI
jgi:hypothetical protein